MGEMVSVLAILASMAFFIEVLLERIKSFIPFVKGTYRFQIKGVEFRICPMQYISLFVSMGLMLAMKQQVSLFAPLGYSVPRVVDAFINGFIISGGSGLVHDITDKWQNKTDVTNINK